MARRIQQRCGNLTSSGPSSTGPPAAPLKRLRLPLTRQPGMLHLRGVGFHIIRTPVLDQARSHTRGTAKVVARLSAQLGLAVLISSTSARSDSDCTL